MDDDKKELIVASETRTVRNHKDTMFCRLFSEPEKALSLYNAIRGTQYNDVSKLEIVTMENSLYILMKNDVGILLNNRLALIEHQSSMNPNMPLRGLLYFSRTIDGLLTREGRKAQIYRNELVKIPTPEYYILYNGTEEDFETKDLRLSDAFEHMTTGYEWTAHMININIGHNEHILNASKDLLGYSTLVSYIRAYMAEEMQRDAAIDKAVQRCIDEGHLREFLLKVQGEARYMLFDFDQDLYDETMKEIGREEGREEGEMIRMIKLICQKYSNGQNTKDISRDLLEDEGLVEEIIKTAEPFAPEYNSEEIYKAYKTQVTKLDEVAV